MKKAKRNWKAIAKNANALSAACGSLYRVAAGKFGIRNIGFRMESGKAAYTDGRSIHVGIDFPLFDGLDGKVRIMAVCGTIFHEIGHILYTPFVGNRNCVDSLEQGEMLSDDLCDSDTVEEICRFMKDEDKAVTHYVLSSYMEISNILEDGRLESRMLKKMELPLFCSGLKLVRERHYAAMVPAQEIIERAEEDAITRLEGMKTLLLYYAKYGEVKGVNEDNIDEEIISDLAALLPYIDRYLASDRHLVVLAYWNLIFTELWEKYILPAAMQVKEASENVQETMNALNGLPGMESCIQIENAAASARRSIAAGAAGESLVTRTVASKAGNGGSPESESENGTGQESELGCSQGGEESCSSESEETEGASPEAEASEQGSETTETSLESPESPESEEEEGSDTDNGVNPAISEEDNSSDTDSSCEESAASTPDSESEEETEKDGTGDSNSQESSTGSPSGEGEEDGELASGSADEDGEGEDRLAQSGETGESPGNSGPDGSQQAGASATAGRTEGGVPEGRPSPREKLLGHSENTLNYEDDTVSVIEGSEFKAAECSLDRILEPALDGETLTEIEEAELIDRLSDMGRLARRHTHVPYIVSPVHYVPGGEEMYSQYEDISRVMRAKARKLRKELQFRNSPVMQKKQYSGTKFNASAVAGCSLKYFSRREVRKNAPGLSVAILIDQSGSMTGEKIDIARAAAVQMYEFCRELDLPLAVYGHSGWDACTIYSYCHYNDRSEAVRYRLTAINARASNFDGPAIDFVASDLMKQRSERKLMFVISDGMPCGDGYTGIDAAQDVVLTVDEYRRKGVNIIAAAIDGDRPQIHALYRDCGFLDISDIKALPGLLVAAVKRELL